MSRVFAIADIHGHFAQLTDLMETLERDAQLDPAADTVVFLGDYVDRGPQTRQVTDQLIAWQQQFPHWVFLKGNHEDLMLDALVYNGRKYGDYYLWWNQGGRETAHSYLPDDATDYERAIMQPIEFIPTSHLDWLNARPLTHDQDGFLFVHAGFRPKWRLDAQRDEDMLWIREAFYLHPYNFGKPVVFGHTPFERPLIVHNPDTERADHIVAIGIDTMFHDYGSLTAVELNPDNPHAQPRFFSSSATPFPE